MVCGVRWEVSYIDVPESDDRRERKSEWREREREKGKAGGMVFGGINVTVERIRHVSAGEWVY